MNSRTTLPEDLYLGPVSGAPAKVKEAVDRAGGFTPEGTDDYTVLYIPRDARLTQHIQLINMLRASGPEEDRTALLVIADENSEARLLVCQHADTQGVPLSSFSETRILALPNSSFDLYDLEETTENTHRRARVTLRQERDSRVVINMLTLYNGDTSNEVEALFAGENASLKLYGMGICDRQRKLSMRTVIDHAVPRCHSDELYKISADEEAQCSFDGRIIVREGSVKTEAYQSSRNLLNGDRARIEAQPELEIYNDDVKCSHGCAIGQLDPLQVFYMRTRGIPDEEARLLLRQAFMADVLDAVAIPALNQRLRLLVERRFAGDASAACGACNPS